MPLHGDADRFHIARDARDQNGAADVVVIHLDDPAIGEVFGRFGNFPAQD
jgi:hypothetical protein